MMSSPFFYPRSIQCLRISASGKVRRPAPLLISLFHPMRGKYFPVLWLQPVVRPPRPAGFPTCRSRGACVPGHVAAETACVRRSTSPSDREATWPVGADRGLFVLQEDQLGHRAEGERERKETELEAAREGRLSGMRKEPLS
ncbi:unnamed protein product [Menidia menidia]|uniref:(Atlantic silverside) hypothetical protein n=1 Tax=Menidia menidia TaxID=238744 RepID=A0A8S4B9I3_9TELE|nr:unnamed protein product [Menidia menidia]